MKANANDEFQDMDFSNMNTDFGDIKYEGTEHNTPLTMDNDLVAEKDERISEFKERIEELKSK